MASQLIEAVAYLHARCIYHRDICLENILFDPNKGTIGLSNLSLATKSKYSIDSVSNVSFSSPECLELPLDVFGNTIPYNCEKNDVFGTGVAICAILTAKMPWNMASSEEGNFLKFTNNPDSIWSMGLTDKYTHMVKGMLEINHGKRCRMEDALVLDQTSGE